MASFYGNITNSTRSAFIFDRIYHTRYEMDQAAETDGIYNTRYVLVDYGNPPACGYKLDNNFYSDPSHHTQITPVNGTLYQDLSVLNTDQSFYIYGGDLGAGYHATTEDPYAVNYNLDVHHYGRGYGASIWMKTIDGDTQKYKYILVADLDPAVPTIHLVADPPNSMPIAPYFDKNSTNINYYMHVQAPWAARINVAPNVNKSDETITFPRGTWNAITFEWTYSTQSQPGDIYYNKAGFSKYVRSYDSTTANTINYAFGQSGQKYYGTLDGVHGSNGTVANDQYLWYIHLPSIGNTICEVWDYMFTNARLVELLKETGDNSDQSTVDTDSVLGLTNSMRCYMGFIKTIPPSATQTNNTIYLPATAAGGNLEYAKSILYLDTVATDGTKYRHYYYPSYYSIWTADNNGDYYRAADGSYRKANKAVLGSGIQYYRRQTGIANDNNTNPHIRFTEQYFNDTTKIGSGLAAVEASETAEAPTTVYAALAIINRLLGTTLDTADSRDERTLLGLMNTIRDIINNIDTQLQPNAIVVTDANGRITTKAAGSANSI